MKQKLKEGLLTVGIDRSIIPTKQFFNSIKYLFSKILSPTFEVEDDVTIAYPKDIIFWSFQDLFNEDFNQNIEDVFVKLSKEVGVAYEEIIFAIFDESDPEFDEGFRNFVDESDGGKIYITLYFKGVTHHVTEIYNDYYRDSSDSVTFLLVNEVGNIVGALVHTPMTLHNIYF